MESNYRRSNGSSNRNSSSARSNTRRTSNNKKQKNAVISPAIVGLIAIVVVCAACIPLFISASNKSSSENNTDIFITSEQLGYSVVTPEESVIDILENDNPQVSQDDPGVFYEKGVTDEHIKEIQSKLMSLGYMVEDEPTTLFGPATEEAVKLFQTKHGLNVTGQVDQTTYDMLFSDSTVFYTASVGSNGSDVAMIQSLLSKLGYFTGNSTGYFGTETEAAVKKFQQSNGLTADGKVGINTLKALKSSNAIAYVPPSPSVEPSNQPV